MPRPALHPRVPALAEATRAGAMSRREFLATATALGVGAAAALDLICAAPAAAQPRAGRMGGTLRVSLTVMPLTDPRLYDWPAMGNLGRQVFEPLVQYAPDMTFRPHLLERWEANADASAYLLHVREGVRWSDGAPFDAEDVAYNIRRWCDRRVPGNSMAARMGTLIDPRTDQLAEGVLEVRDARTIALTLPRPDITLIPGMADYPALIVPQSYDGAAPPGAEVPGTGPFRMVEHVTGARATFEKRPAAEYWGEEVFLDRIEMIDLGADRSAEVAAFLAGEIDINDQTQIDFVDVLDAAGFTSSRIDTSSTIVARMNVNSPPYDDKRVRNALQLAVDNAIVLELGHDDRGLVAENHHVGPMHPEYAALPRIAPDPEEARRLLAEAKQLDTEFELISTDGDWRTLTSDAIAAQLRDAGLKVKRTKITARAFAQNWASYPFSTTDWNHRPLGVQNLALAYRTGEAWNETGFSDPQFDLMLNAAMAVPDPFRRRLVMADIERRLQDAGVIIQPYWRPIYTHSAPHVHGHEAHPLTQLDLTRIWVEARAEDADG